MMKNICLILLAVISQGSAFAPQHLGSASEVSLKSTSDISVDPFDTFGSETTSIAVKDIAFGEGEPIADGDVVTVKYIGKLFPSQTQFGKTDQLPVKLGAGNLVKGFEQSLIGKKVGSEFIVRMPAELGWGDRGRISQNTGRQVIPPGSALQFEVEVVNVATGIMGEIEMFGKDRVATLALCTFLLAFSGQIETLLNKLLGF
jgi:peptidylprolyl isomerase